MKNVVTFVLGGGRGTRLYPLTKYRAKPAVPLAGKYRLIDIPLSNCLNSGLNRIYVLTQFMSVSLHRHIRQTYRFDNFSGGFVELLAAQQTMEEGTDWYQGTADAVRKNVRYLQQPGVKYVLILSGDQLYRMDYRKLIETHQQTKADVTIAALLVSGIAAGGLGVMRTDESGRVIGFVEKPKTEEQLMPVRLDPKWLEKRGVAADGRDCLGNMGIYLFNRDLLVELMTKTQYQDFGKEIFPQSISTRHVQVHLFDDYWEDIGTIKAFYDANLSLVRPDPPYRLSSAEAPVYSRGRYLPPSKIDGATIRSSFVADGCQIGEGAVIENSIIGLRSAIGPGATIRDSILMGDDYYEGAFELEQNRLAGQPPLGVGAGCVIEGAIIDKNCHIGREVRIVNENRVENSNGDNDTCMIRDGIPIVLKEAVLPDKWRLQG
ncbi:MAG TPA: glucose-1-phosphate adenylyltransferase [Candidatus Anammoximicrobium sp.]|nr:glucose-1-phosphate adenylyltransferase [Candidatus Anammoximicrobium sp.]